MAMRQGRSDQSARAAVGAEAAGAGGGHRCPVRSRCDPRELVACAEAAAGAVEASDAAGLEVLKALPHLVYWKDGDGRYVGCNEAFLRERRVGSAEQIVGRTEEELALPDAFSATLPPIERSVMTSGVPASGVQSLAAPAAAQGEQGVPDAASKLLLTVLPLRTAQGRVTGVIGVGADVSGLSDLDQRLSHASRMESIGRLAENIAHQINTPVQFITDNVRFVADGVAETLHALEAVQAAVGTDHGEGGGAAVPARSAEQALAAVQEAIGGLDVDYLVQELPGSILESLEGLSQIAQIVSALKSYSRPESRMVSSQLNRLIDNAVSLAGPQWMPVADLQLQLAAEIPELACYEGELRQVLLNLVVNAAQAVTVRQAEDPGYGKGLIEVRSEHDAGAGVVTVVVRDDGCGMDEATRARIFDPFFTTKEFGQSSGQGLSLAWATIVNRHNGAIQVDSVPGAGTTVTVTLPSGGATAGGQQQPEGSR